MAARCAAHERAIVAVIGNLNFGDAKFAENLARFAANPLFRGLRAREKFADADLARGSQLLAERGLALDMNGEPGFVADAVRLAKKVSELRLVIDHVGAAGDARTLSDQWKDDIRRAADQPNVFLKISGLVEQADALAGAAPHELNAYLPILDFVWNRFGEDRLIFASNWPVSEKGATYKVLFGIAREFFASKGKTATEKFFRTNSRAVYRWLDRR